MEQTTAATATAQNSAVRFPEFSDLRKMLCEAVQNYGLFFEDPDGGTDGETDERETVDYLLEKTGDFVDALVSSKIHLRHIITLANIVNEIAVTAFDIDTQGKAREAFAGIKEILPVMWLIEENRPYLEQFAYATANYHGAIRKARKEEYEAYVKEAEARQEAEKRQREIHRLKREAAKIGAMITFSDIDTAPTQRHLMDETPDTGHPTPDTPEKSTGITITAEETGV